MSLGLAFYLIMFLWLIFGLYWNWPAGAPPGQPAVYYPLGGNLLLFILLLLLGWHSFGAPLRG